MYTHKWLVIVTCLSAVFAVHSSQAVVTVGPGGSYDFTTIQAGINWALPGEEVQVYGGSYAENLTITKNLTLTGINVGGARPVINPAAGQAVVISMGKTVEISGFEMTGCQGGIYATNAREVTAYVHDNVFHDLDAGSGFNWGDSTTGGEAIYLGGTLRIYNNLIYNNTGLAGDQSATVRLRSDVANHEFFNNTLFNNTTNGGAAVHLIGPDMLVYNNIIAYQNHGAGISKWDPYGGWTEEVVYNLIYGCDSGVTDGEVVHSRTITEDPQFMDETGLDFHLMATSPAIDAGMAVSLALDLDGTPRPFDYPGVTGPESTYDLGCYELNVVIWPGDANGDGMVNLADLQVLGDNWHSTTATRNQGDFTGDGYVGLDDLQILGDNWGYGVSSDLTFDQAPQQLGLNIPEPGTLLLLCLGVLAVTRRVR
ncbi:MAG: PEP-CTERM sorting domain-containing protein [Phycisphaeraceae bacterium]|nr:PEP-CTERM sorting domain-containing protein [Phycisphaeraceae bacterium]